MAIHTEEIPDYLGLGRAIALTDHQYELVVTLDIGPRILRFSLRQGTNMLADDVQETNTLPDGSIWNLYGGHRIWHSPEHSPRTYQSDSHPVEKFETTQDGIIIWQKPETWTHIQKGLGIRFCDGYVEINNQIKNCGAWPIETAAWAITVFPAQGYAICPVVQADTGLLPNACYATWPYTKWNDPRVAWGEKVIKVSPDPKNTDEFKFGYSNENGWLAYFLGGNLFMKQYTHQKGVSYPDYGCSSEVYTSYFGLELETLSPMSTIEPDQMIEHREYWHIKQIPGQFSLDSFKFEGMILDI